MEDKEKKPQNSGDIVERNKKEEIKI